jgi:lipopolysaccharide/colanic/teichoic acid biosynthesis glycosyltransferase
MITKSEHWNFSKVAKLAVCQLIAMSVCLFVILYHSPVSETLLQVNRERLLFYAASFGVFFLLAGEVSGLFVDQKRSSAWKRVFLTLVSSGLGVFGLIILVWTIEFDFVGRFAALKMLGGVGLIAYFFITLQDFLSRRNPWRTLVLVSDERRKEIRSYIGPEEANVAWVDLDGDPTDKESLLRSCDASGVELLLLEEEQECEVPIMPMLASGVKVMGIAAFVETFCQRIPPAEVDAAWLTKLNLGQRDPIARRVKRLNDLLLAFLGLVLSFPLLLLAGVAIVLDSGFPIFFHQTRTGYLGRPYVLHKLRTMRQGAEEGVAQWAQEQDMRVTLVGRFLRKTRIDEIPQLWNVIKGEMSLVGPRPERPELDEEIERTSSFWKCRYLLKPGITGWAQIRYRYASDIESSDEKLSYDLFYVKNASFFLDLEIILSTLRSLMKGSR